MNEIDHLNKILICLYDEYVNQVKRDFLTAFHDNNDPSQNYVALKTLTLY